MKPYYENELGKLYHGDALDILPHLEPADAIVTDPPYGLSFMGKSWDHGVPGREFWEAVQAKPGAFMLAFGGTRTVHRLTCAIEDAGWEIRDCIMWLYGSGFPKSLDISKAIDKSAGAERELTTPRGKIGTNKTRVEQGYRPNEVAQSWNDAGPVTTAAREWSGWGTALKPAYEPIIVARRPIEGTVAANVRKYGTGGINVDGCRILGWKPQVVQGVNSNASSFNVAKERRISGDSNVGRWPANVIHDGSEEVLAGFPNSKSCGGNRAIETGKSIGTFKENIYRPFFNLGDTGSAARFFYTAKASRRDRGKHNTHPTVKPFKLIRYLTRLVSKRGALVLDPFAGSCTLAVVCEHLRRRWICIELDEASCATGVKRIEAERKQLKLF